MSELTPEDASSTFAAALPLQSLDVMLSRCMTGNRRAVHHKVCLRRGRNRKAQGSTALTLCIVLRRSDSVFSRWMDRTCNSHQKNRRAGCNHRQLETWWRSREAPDIYWKMDDWFKTLCDKSGNRPHVGVYSDHACCPKTRKKHICIPSVLWFAHATFHQHSARSYRPELGRVRVVRPSEGDITRTWSGLNAQRFGSRHQQKHKD